MITWCGWPAGASAPCLSRTRFCAARQASRWYRRCCGTDTIFSFALVESLGERLTDVRMVVVKGEPAEVISAIAVEQQADSIVMGSMGRSGLAVHLHGEYRGTRPETLARLGVCRQTSWLRLARGARSGDGT
jgi:hypothetical protein